MREALLRSLFGHFADPALSQNFAEELPQWRYRNVIILEWFSKAITKFSVDCEATLHCPREEVPGKKK